MAGIALGGCNSSCNHADGCAYQRNEPTAAQRAGATSVSVAHRLRRVRRLVGPTIDGLLVNRWGEIWVERDHKVTAISHDGTRVHPSDSVDESPPEGDPIPVSAIRAAAIDRALRRIARHVPGQPFVKATLERDDFLWGGLRWEFQVGSDSHHFYATYAASPDGRQICEVVRFDHGKTTNPRKCPHFGHQPKHLPEPH